MNRLYWGLSLIALLTGLNAFAAPTETKRQKVIDFEDDVVEGVNKRPLDSLSQISEAERRRRRPHLYRKRGGFKAETAETFRTLRFIP